MVIETLAAVNLYLALCAADSSGSLTRFVPLDPPVQPVEIGYWPGENSLDDDDDDKRIRELARKIYEIWRRKWE